MKLTDSQSKDIAKHKQFGIEFEFINNTIVISQKQLLNCCIFSKKDLNNIAKELFPNGNVLSIPYSTDFEIVTVDWIKSKMLEYNIDRTDLVAQLGMNESYLSRLFAKDDKKYKINLTTQVKAMFFYYFLVFENRGRYART